MPIRWEEPFGMVMVEAMAEGTPVVALDRGAVREVVHSGVTGLVCSDPVELPDALNQVTMIDPFACIAHVRRYFSAALMARRYAHVYRRVMHGTRHMVPVPALTGVGTSHHHPHHPHQVGVTRSRTRRPPGRPRACPAGDCRRPGARAPAPRRRTGLACCRPWVWRCSRWCWCAWSPAAPSGSWRPTTAPPPTWPSCAPR